MASIERLYHYTTPDGLIGIVSTNTLWATSVFYLDDARELIGGIQIAQTELCAIREMTTASYQSDRIDWLLLQLCNFGKPSFSKPVFVCSLTSERDQLSQWRAYCRGGGFAVGFPADQLSEAVKCQQFDLHECLYSEADQNALIETIVHSIVLP